MLTQRKYLVDDEMEVMALAELHQFNQIFLAVAATKRIVWIRHHDGLYGDRCILQPLFQRGNHALTKDVVETADSHGNRDDARVDVEEHLVGA